MARLKIVQIVNFPRRRMGLIQTRGIEDLNVKRDGQNTRKDEAYEGGGKNSKHGGNTVVLIKCRLGSRYSSQCMKRMFLNICMGDPANVQVPQQTCTPYHACTKLTGDLKRHCLSRV